MGIGGRGEQAQRQQAQREAEAGVLYNEIPGYPVTFKLWGLAEPHSATTAPPRARAPGCEGGSSRTRRGTTRSVLPRIFNYAASKPLGNTWATSDVARRRAVTMAVTLQPTAAPYETVYRAAQRRCQEPVNCQGGEDSRHG